MKRFIFELDETSAKVLEGKVNKAEVVRKALALYNGDIKTDSIEGLREAFKRTQQETREINIKLKVLADLIAPIARKAGTAYDPTEFNDWGA